MKRRTEFSLLLFICFCTLNLSLKAQPFQKAPVLPQKVKKIVEWARPDFSYKAKKISSSFFDKDGKILTYHSEGMEPKSQRVYQYDHQKRLIKQTEGIDVDQEMIRYIYGKRYTTKEKHFRGKVYKEVTFRNEKNMATEQKMYAKGLELGDSCLLYTSPSPRD